jgi:hypothetical protein
MVTGKEVYMHKILKQSTVLFLAALLIVIPFGATAFAQVELEKKEPSAGAMTYDLFILRPFGAAAGIVCAGIFVLSLPFAAIGGTVPQTTEKLVVNPFKFTITRPLGYNRFNLD